MRNRSIAKWGSAMLVLGSLALPIGSAGVAHGAASAEGLLTAEERMKELDQQLQAWIENALVSDPYFYSAHVIVTVKKGTITLGGFVFSDWDLRDAIRIANKAAGGSRVIDNLTIEVGGRR
jgi:osmotically-inducible protein OsmY